VVQVVHVEVQVFIRSPAACGRQRSWTMLSPSWATAPVSKGKTTGSSSKLAVVQGNVGRASSALHHDLGIAWAAGGPWSGL